MTLNAHFVLPRAVFENLKIHMSSSNDVLLEKSLWLLTNLTLEKENVKLVEELGFIPLLIQFFPSRPSNLMCQAVKPLRNLFLQKTTPHFLDNQMIFLKNKGLKPLVKTLR